MDCYQYNGYVQCYCYCKARRQKKKTRVSNAPFDVEYDNNIANRAIDMDQIWTTPHGI